MRWITAIAHPTLLAVACGVDDKDEVLFGEDLGETDVLVDTPDAPTDDTDPPPDTDLADTADTDLAAETADTSIDLQNIEVLITADDGWEMFIDDRQIPPAQNWRTWNYSDTVIADVPGRRHVVAIHSLDLAQVIAGMEAAVWVSHELYSLTGDNRWVMTNTFPGPGWQRKRFDDSAWRTPDLCTPQEVAVWGGRPEDIAATGAQWVWQAPCFGLGEAWFRLKIGY